MLLLFFGWFGEKRLVVWFVVKCGMLVLVVMVVVMVVLFLCVLWLMFLIGR